MSKFAGALVAITIAFSTSQASPLDSPTVQDAVPEMEDYTPKASAATQLRTAETSAATQLATDEFVTVEGNGNGKNKRRKNKRRRRRRKAPSMIQSTIQRTIQRTNQESNQEPCLRASVGVHTSAAAVMLRERGLTVRGRVALAAAASRRATIVRAI